MDQANSSQLSQLLQDLHEKAGVEHQAAREAAVITFYAASEFLPDDADAAAVQPEEGMPLILAVKDAKLYILETEIAEGVEVPPAICRMVSLNPDAASVQAEVTFRGVAGGGAQIARKILWTFRIEDDLILKFTSDRGPHGQSAGPEETAQRLAAQLGWEMPQG